MPANGRLDLIQRKKFKSVRYWHRPLLHLHPSSPITMSYMALPCIAFTPHHCSHSSITE